MKYLLGILGIVVFGIIAVVLFGNAVDKTNDNAPQETTKSVKTTDYINDSSFVQYTKYGQIVSNQERKTMKIKVSQNESVIEILDGYQETVQDRKSYPNNYESYKNFMYALDKLGYTNKKETSVENPTGVCPSGYTYFYKLNDSGNDLTNLWNSSCKLLGGDLGNNGSKIRDLFTKQIPDYSDIVKNVSFN
jgi:hypothetical protein